MPDDYLLFQPYQRIFGSGSFDSIKVDRFASAIEDFITQSEIIQSNHGTPTFSMTIKL
jgi:hypothetical protein